ncbi:MAG: spermidine/putrescine ABC transporter substrate-binding protein [Thermoleophilaceae bacterium]
MSEYTRRQLLGRGAAAGSVLTLPGLLAACGGGGGGIKAATSTSKTTAVKRQLASTLNFSNWPLYIDVNEKTKKHPTLDAFTKKTGVKVRYVEDINDNDQYFGKIQGPLSKGQGIGKDIIVLTDSSDIPGRMIKLGWVEKLDKQSIPNIKNLQPALAHPSFDQNREYSLPWQSGMTGIGYDPDKVGGELTSIDRLLTDKKLKGKVTMLSLMSDSVGVVLLENGDDPVKPTKAAFDKALARLQKAVDSGQIRQFTGNDYAPLLAKGDVWAALAWSGDMVQLQADHPKLKWNLPETGGMIWTDNMLIPTGGNVYTASVYMNYYYEPKVAAAVEDYVNYICPVKGADKVLVKTNPEVAKNPLIFPTKAMLDNVHIMGADALADPAFKKKFAALIGA